MLDYILVIFEGITVGTVTFLGFGSWCGVGSGSDWMELAGVPGWMMI